MADMQRFCALILLAALVASIDGLPQKWSRPVRNTQSEVVRERRQFPFGEWIPLTKTCPTCRPLIDPIDVAQRGDNIGLTPPRPPTVTRQIHGEGNFFAAQDESSILSVPPPPPSAIPPRHPNGNFHFQNFGHFTNSLPVPSSPIFPQSQPVQFLSQPFLTNQNLLVNSNQPVLPGSNSVFGQTGQAGSLVNEKHPKFESAFNQQKFTENVVLEQQRPLGPPTSSSVFQSKPQVNFGKQQTFFQQNQQPVVQQHTNNFRDTILTPPPVGNVTAPEVPGLAKEEIQLLYVPVETLRQRGNFQQQQLHTQQQQQQQNLHSQQQQQNLHGQQQQNVHGLHHQQQQQQNLHGQQQQQQFNSHQQQGQHLQPQQFHSQQQNQQSQLHLQQQQNQQPQLHTQHQQFHGQQQQHQQQQQQNIQFHSRPTTVSRPSFHSTEAPTTTSPFPKGHFVTHGQGPVSTATSPPFSTPAQFSTAPTPATVFFQHVPPQQTPASFVSATPVTSTPSPFHGTTASPFTQKFTSVPTETTLSHLSTLQNSIQYSIPEFEFGTTPKSLITEEGLREEIITGKPQFDGFQDQKIQHHFTFVQQPPQQQQHSQGGSFQHQSFGGQGPQGVNVQSNQNKVFFQQQSTELQPGVPGGVKDATHGPEQLSFQQQQEQKAFLQKQKEKELREQYALKQQRQQKEIEAQRLSEQKELEDQRFFQKQQRQKELEDQRLAQEKHQKEAEQERVLQQQRQNELEEQRRLQRLREVEEKRLRQQSQRDQEEKRLLHWQRQQKEQEEQRLLQQQQQKLEEQKRAQQLQKAERQKQENYKKQQQFYQTQQQQQQQQGQGVQHQQQQQFTQKSKHRFQEADNANFISELEKESEDDSQQLVPHQPPLSVFYKGYGRGEPKIGDVLRELRSSKTITVLDQYFEKMPTVFVGPAGLTPPSGYDKFELPYLSNIESNAIEKKVNRLPFFVAPLNFVPPAGYSKIPFPSPHVGSVVISTESGPVTTRVTPIGTDSSSSSSSSEEESDPTSYPVVGPELPGLINSLETETTTVKPTTPSLPQTTAQLRNRRPNTNIYRTRKPITKTRVTSTTTTTTTTTSRPDDYKSDDEGGLRKPFNRFLKRRRQQVKSTTESAPKDSVETTTADGRQYSSQYLQKNFNFQRQKQFGDVTTGGNNRQYGGSQTVDRVTTVSQDEYHVRPTPSVYKTPLAGNFVSVKGQTVKTSEDDDSTNNLQSFEDGPFPTGSAKTITQELYRPNDLSSKDNRRFSADGSSTANAHVKGASKQVSDKFYGQSEPGKVTDEVHTTAVPTKSSEEGQSAESVTAHTTPSPNFDRKYTPLSTPQNYYDQTLYPRTESSPSFIQYTTEYTLLDDSYTSAFAEISKHHHLPRPQEETYQTKYSRDGQPTVGLSIELEAPSDETYSQEHSQEYLQSEGLKAGQTYTKVFAPTESSSEEYSTSQEELTRNEHGFSESDSREVTPTAPGFEYTANYLGKSKTPLNTRLTGTYVSSDGVHVTPAFGFTSPHNTEYSAGTTEAFSQKYATATEGLQAVGVDSNEESRLSSSDSTKESSTEHPSLVSTKEEQTEQGQGQTAEDNLSGSQRQRFSNQSALKARTRVRGKQRGQATYSTPAVSTTPASVVRTRTETRYNDNSDQDYATKQNGEYQNGKYSKYNNFRGVKRPVRPTTEATTASVEADQKPNVYTVRPPKRGFTNPATVSTKRIRRPTSPVPTTESSTETYSGTDTREPEYPSSGFSNDVYYERPTVSPVKYKFRKHYGSTEQGRDASPTAKPTAFPAIVTTYSSYEDSRSREEDYSTEYQPDWQSSVSDGDVSGVAVTTLRTVTTDKQTDSDEEKKFHDGKKAFDPDLEKKNGRRRVRIRVHKRPHENFETAESQNLRTVANILVPPTSTYKPLDEGTLSKNSEFSFSGNKYGQRSREYFRKHLNISFPEPGSAQQQQQQQQQGSSSFGSSGSRAQEKAYVAGDGDSDSNSFGVGSGKFLGKDTIETTGFDANGKNGTDGDEVGKGQRTKFRGFVRKVVKHPVGRKDGEKQRQTSESGDGEVKQDNTESHSLPHFKFQGQRGFNHTGKFNGTRHKTLVRYIKKHKLRTQDESQQDGEHGKGDSALNLSTTASAVGALDDVSTHLDDSQSQAEGVDSHSQSGQNVDSHSTEQTQSLNSHSGQHGLNLNTHSSDQVGHLGLHGLLHGQTFGSQSAEHSQSQESQSGQSEESSSFQGSHTFGSHTGHLNLNLNSFAHGQSHGVNVHTEQNGQSVDTQTTTGSGASFGSLSGHGTASESLNQQQNLKSHSGEQAQTLEPHPTQQTVIGNSDEGFAHTLHLAATTTELVGETTEYPHTGLPLDSTTSKQSDTETEVPETHSTTSETTESHKFRQPFHGFTRVTKLYPVSKQTTESDESAQTKATEISLGKASDVRLPYKNRFYQNVRPVYQRPQQHSGFGRTKEYTPTSTEASTSFEPQEKRQRPNRYKYGKGSSYGSSSNSDENAEGQNVKTANNVQQFSGQQTKTKTGYNFDVKKLSRNKSKEGGFSQFYRNRYSTSEKTDTSSSSSASTEEYSQESERFGTSYERATTYEPDTESTTASSSSEYSSTESVDFKTTRDFDTSTETDASRSEEDYGTTRDTPAGYTDSAESGEDTTTESVETTESNEKTETTTAYPRTTLTTEKTTVTATEESSTSPSSEVGSTEESSTATDSTDRTVAQTEPDLLYRFAKNSFSFDETEKFTGTKNRAYVRNITADIIENTSSFSAPGVEEKSEKFASPIVSNDNKVQTEESGSLTGNEKTDGGAEVESVTANLKTAEVVVDGTSSSGSSSSSSSDGNGQEVSISESDSVQSSKSKTKISKLVKTSTQTKVSHETEICYKGKCIRTKSENPDDDLKLLVDSAATASDVEKNKT